MTTFRVYPCWRYAAAETPLGYEARLCPTAADVEALGDGWIDTPAPFVAALAARESAPGEALAPPTPDRPPPAHRDTVPVSPASSAKRQRASPRREPAP